MLCGRPSLPVAAAVALGRGRRKRTKSASSWMRSLAMTAMHLHICLHHTKLPRSYHQVISLCQNLLFQVPSYLHTCKHHVSLHIRTNVLDLIVTRPSSFAKPDFASGTYTTGNYASRASPDVIIDTPKGRNGRGEPKAPPGTPTHHPVLWSEYRGGLSVTPSSAKGSPGPFTPQRSVTNPADVAVARGIRLPDSPMSPGEESDASTIVPRNQQRSALSPT